MDDKTFYVYELIDNKSEKLLKTFYVGKGSGDRMYDHEEWVEKYIEKEQIPKKSNMHLFYKIKKILDRGDEIEYKKIFFTNDEGLAYIIEEVQIMYYGLENLCNIERGGFGRSSITNIERYGEKRADEISKSQSEKTKGRTPHNKGKTDIECYGEERAKEISFKKGVITRDKDYAQIYGSEERADEEKKKRSEAHKGKSHTKEHRKNNSIAQKGIKRGPQTKEHIRKRSEAQKETKFRISQLKEKYFFHFILGF